MNLHEKLLELRKYEKKLSAKIIDLLQIMEDKKSYLAMGYSSLFDYLTRGLGYSGSTAYQRQSCIRLSKYIPEIKEKIDNGSLTYSTISMAYKAIKNKPLKLKREVLKSIENKTTKEVKELLLEPSKEIKIKKQEFQDKVVLKLELSKEQFKKLEQLKALKSHTSDYETLFSDFITKELKKYGIEKNEEADKLTKDKNSVESVKSTIASLVIDTSAKSLLKTNKVAKNKGSAELVNNTTISLAIDTSSESPVKTNKAAKDKTAVGLMNTTGFLLASDTTSMNLVVKTKKLNRADSETNKKEDKSKYDKTCKPVDRKSRKASKLYELGDRPYINYENRINREQLDKTSINTRKTENPKNKQLDLNTVEDFSIKSKNPRYIPTKLKNYLLKEANYRCQYKNCNSNHYLQVDHIKPIRVGGRTEVSNLQILCGAHNRMKGWKSKEN